MTNKLDDNLAAYAVKPSISKGRKYKEEESSGRSIYQRDRERIIHTTAFRRLQYKTQVFVNDEGDHFRTRLTHTIEVAQISRAIARLLYINEDLAEAIALAHDLGHTPFGHAGQDALNSCMKDHGGFEHNIQSLRIIDKLEIRYENFDGLNLTHETREGILKRCNKKTAEKLGEVAERFLVNKNGSLESQIVNFADEIAYNNHDLEDGIKSQKINFSEIQNLEIVAKFKEEIKKNNDQISQSRLVKEIIRRMINFLITDLVINTKNLLIKNKISSYEDVRDCKNTIVGFSAETKKMNADLKKFLFKNLYKHEDVMVMTRNADKIISELFAAYTDNISLIPNQFRAYNIQKIQSEKKFRLISDYISGMTDRFAEKEHKKL